LRSSQRISSRTLSTLKTSNTTRLVSLIITGMLLLLLGVRRGLVGHRNIVLTALETLGIVAAAALAGFLIGKLVTHQTKDGLIA
jgi:VIT1/CCC1 family predicted Fe2+/Mn2+ transporter